MYETRFDFPDAKDARIASSILKKKYYVRCEHSTVIVSHPQWESWAGYDPSVLGISIPRVDPCFDNCVVLRANETD